LRAEEAPSIPSKSVKLESSAGKVIEAEVIGLTDSVVSVRRADGQSFEIPFSNLSPVSVQLLNELKKSDESLYIEVPPKLQLEALKSLREGPMYYIWRDVEEPVIVQGLGGLINVSVNYVCRGVAKPFATSFQVIVKEGGDLVGEAQVMTPADFQPDSKGTFPILYYGSQNEYSGKGPSALSYVDPDTNEPLSNTIIIQVQWD